METKLTQKFKPFNQNKLGFQHYDKFPIETT